MINIISPSWKIDDIETIFFDKDGTIIDSHIYWGRIIEKRSSALIDNFNMNRLKYNELCKVMGLSRETSKLLPEGPIALVERDKVIEIVLQYLRTRDIAVTAGEIKKIFSDVHHNFLDEIYDYIKILPGVLNLLETLKQRNIKTAIITSDRIVNTEKIIAHLNIKDYFDQVIGLESTPEPKVSGKPAIVALELMKTDARHTICIGDAPMDIIMSKKANLKAAIGIALGQTPFEDLQRETPYAAHNYSELKIV
jgi:phosphoglycolate phosphatase-like HAD superfamily hydrolase